MPTSASWPVDSQRAQRPTTWPRPSWSSQGEKLALYRFSPRSRPSIPPRPVPMSRKSDPGPEEGETWQGRPTRSTTTALRSSGKGGFILPRPIATAVRAMAPRAVIRIIPSSGKRNGGLLPAGGRRRPPGRRDGDWRAILSDQGGREGSVCTSGRIDDRSGDAGMRSPVALAECAGPGRTVIRVNRPVTGYPHEAVTVGLPTVRHLQDPGGSSREDCIATGKPTSADSCKLARLNPPPHATVSARSITEWPTEEGFAADPVQRGGRRRLPRIARLRHSFRLRHAQALPVLGAPVVQDDPESARPVAETAGLAGGIGVALVATVGAALQWS